MLGSQLQVSEPADNATNTTSSNITDRATDDEETPITSPSNSDFQFPQETMLLLLVVW